MLSSNRFNILRFLYLKYISNLKYTIDVCPGPFDFDNRTPIEITNYFINSIEPLCHRTSSILSEPYHTSMISRTIHKDNYVGPSWTDYLDYINSSYDCGPLYNNITDTYVLNVKSDIIHQTSNNGYPTQLPEYSINYTDSCMVGMCETSNGTDFCNPIGSKTLDNNGCICPFGGINNPLGDPNINNPGCYVQPRFNWIIGACQGSSCNGNYNVKSLQKYKNIGSQLIINYIASYNFDTFDNKWKMDIESSFNVDGLFEPFHTMKARNKDAWLNVQVGGSVQWGWGFHPTGVSGLGPLATKKSTPGLIGKSGGMMFILSTESSYNFAFYMLNQATLDRGPGSPACQYQGKIYNNCWSSGNAGEIDFLESPFSAPNGTIDNYSRMYLNNINQFGRSFPSIKGHMNGGWGEDWETSAMMTGTNPFANPKPLIYVAIVDKIGIWVYRIPIDNNNKTVWNGISRKIADNIVDRIPYVPPNDYQPCDNDKDDYCLMFIPNCEASNAQDAHKKDCAYTDNQGFCGNWFQLLHNTYQWQTDGKRWNTVVTDNYITDNNEKLSWNKKMKPYKCKEAYSKKCME